MDFGVVLQPNPPTSEFVGLMRTAEKAGFTHGWTFDSCVLWQEPYVLLTQVLANTTTLTVGPMVTNPATRDPVITASTFATLNATFGNRAVCAIGRGDSAVRVTGGCPTTLRALEEAAGIIKELAEGRDSEVGGASIRFGWATGGELPVWIAGYGPRALELAGRFADGFVVQLADVDLVRWMIERVRSAARDVGRDPAEITMCVTAPAYVGDRAHAREQCRWFGGMVGNHVADLVRRYRTGVVPTALTDYIRTREGYDYRHHGQVGNPDAEFVPDEIVDRFCVLGSVDEQLSKLRALAAVGVDHFAMYAMHDAKEELIATYGKTIIPALGDEKPPM